MAKTPNVTINAEPSKKYTVQVGVSNDDLLEWDRQGVVLLFEQKEGFLPLPDAVRAKLSRENQLRYDMAKEFHDAWRGDEHAKLVENFQVDRQAVGSAMDKMTLTAGSDMKVRWVRPDNVERMREKGYKILSADEARSYLGPTGGHHEIGHLGQTELVAMGIPKELAHQSDLAKVRRNKEMAGSWKGISKEITRQGGQGFVAEEADKKHSWTESPVED